MFQLGVTWRETVNVYTWGETGMWQAKVDIGCTVYYY